MKKIIYIIPGFLHSPKQKEYQKLKSIFLSKGYDVVLADVKWKYQTMSDYVRQFTEKIKIDKRDKRYVLGFSFGAMIAMISATKIKFDELILCSLSPYFKEDIKNMKKSWKDSIGKNRIEDFQKYSAGKLSKNIKSDTFLFMGENEPIELKNRVEKTHRQIINSKLVIIPNTKHELNKEYIDKIKTYYEHHRKSKKIRAV